jgi:ABC-2 type transport system permease protein
VSAFSALVRKDLKLYFSNRRAVLITLAAPILIAAFFGSVMGGAPRKPTAIPIAVVDQDGSEVSKALVAAIRGDATFALEEPPLETARTRVREGKLRVAVVLPKGFGDDAKRALFRPDMRKPDVEILADPSQTMAMEMIKGLVVQHAMQAVGRAVLDPKQARQMIEESRDAVKSSARIDETERRDLLALFDQVEKLQARADRPSAGGSLGAGGFTMPFTFHQSDVTSGERKYNGYAHSFAGMGVQFVLFMGIEMGVGVLLMRRLGIWRRLRAAPVSRALLLGSRIASGTLIAFILLSVIYLAGIAFFNVRIDGSVGGFAGIGLAFALLTSTFGLLIAALGRTPEATRGLAVLATLLLVMLGGAWVPSFVFPEWLQKATLWVPTRWAIDGLEAMTWRGLGIDAALAPIAVMLAFSAVFGWIAVKRFDWEE